MLFSEFYNLKFLYFVTIYLVCWSWQMCIGVILFLLNACSYFILYWLRSDKAFPLFIHYPFSPPCCDLWCSMSNVMWWCQKWCEYFSLSHLSFRCGLSTHFVYAHELKLVLRCSSMLEAHFWCFSIRI